jgi:hypothetical protein
LIPESLESVTLANLTASSLTQDGNPRLEVFGDFANWAYVTGPMSVLRLEEQASSQSKMPEVWNVTIDVCVAGIAHRHTPKTGSRGRTAVRGLYKSFNTTTAGFNRLFRDFYNDCAIFEEPKMASIISMFMFMHEFVATP